MRELFVGAVLALPFVVYAVLALARKARYRSLASELGAVHVDRGWFAPGAIAGEGFEIEAAKVGKGFRTRVQVDVLGSPGQYLLRPGFFGHAPDWDFAFVPGRRDERVFLWHVSLNSFVRPTQEQRDRLLAWLGRSERRRGVRDALARARIGEIALDESSLSVEFSGIVSNLARLQGTLGALRCLARDPREAAAALAG